MLGEELGAKDLIAQALSYMGGMYYSQGNYEKSLEFSQRSVTLARLIGSPERLLLARTIEGQAQRSLNRPDQARQAFQEAIDTIETVRGQLSGNEQQQEQFFENKLSPYQAMVELLIAQNKNNEALAYAERAKARMLLDVLRNGRVNIAKAMTSQEQERERKFNSDLVSINNQISREGSRSQPDPSGLANLREQLLNDENLDPLPEAENEVKTLEQLYGAAHSKIYVVAEAREDRLKADAPKFTLLHLATHGILNDASPMYSQIVLSQA